MQRVAIEDSLQQVKDFLKNKGYDIVQLNQESNNADVIIISGQDKDMMGMQDITTQAPVINAEGLTAEEVYKQLSNHFQA